MKKLNKLGVLVMGMALLTFVPVQVSSGAVTLGLAGSGADFIDNGTGNNFGNARVAAKGEIDKTLIILEGIYNIGTVYISENDITIKANPGDTVVINGNLRLQVAATGLTIEGLHINGGTALSAIMFDGAAGALILDNYLTAANGYGVISLLSGDVSGLRISGNVIYSAVGGEGQPVIFGWSTGSVDIDHNTVFGFTTWGIYLVSATFTATNNLLNVTTSIVSTATGSASYNAGVPTYGGPGPGPNISVPLTGLFASTNPLDDDFLFLGLAAPAAVLTGASDGSFIGALPQVPSPCVSCTDFLQVIIDDICDDGTVPTALQALKDLIDNTIAATVVEPPCDDGSPGAGTEAECEDYIRSVLLAEPVCQILNGILD